jgi:hypothetical protein
MPERQPRDRTAAPVAGRVVGDRGPRRDPVPVVVRLRLPRPADPATVEALLARAMAAADPPVAAELAWVPLLSAVSPADRPVLTYALVLQPGLALAARDHHELLSGARRAARKALRSVFGPGTKVAVEVADSPEILAACSRAIAGNPRAGNPYEA